MRKYLIIGAIGVILLGLCFTSAPYQILTSRTIDNVLIKDKQITAATDKKTGLVGSTYMIYTDNGVFRNDDSFWHLKYNSSDVYGLLDKGKYYDIKVYGWRIPILSMYPNIVKATPVKQGEKK